jgi:cytochrome P450
MEELPHPFAPHVLSQPHAFFRAAHARGPVMKVPGTPFTMVLGYDAVADALGRPDDFGNEFGAVLAGARAADPEVSAI